jgi:hypothetical protein
MLAYLLRKLLFSVEVILSIYSHKGNEFFMFLRKIIYHLNILHMPLQSEFSDAFCSQLYYFSIYSCKLKVIYTLMWNYIQLNTVYSYVYTFMSDYDGKFRFIIIKKKRCLCRPFYRT